jgi:RimJ/RimL family protein N-acetyltransferase
LNHIRGESIIQIGFTLAKPAWGKGFGTEMASAVLRYGFVDLRLSRIAGMASLQNHASQRVLLKIGLERRGERAFPHPDYASEGPMAWFEREAADWLADALITPSTSSTTPRSKRTSGSAARWRGVIAPTSAVSRLAARHSVPVVETDSLVD